MGRKNIKKETRHKTTIHIPINIWRDLHLIIFDKYGGTHGHLGKSFIEALQMWIIKERKKLEKAKAIVQ